MEIRRSGNFGIIDTGSDKGLISFSIGGRGKGWEPSSIQLNRRGAFFSRKISVNGTFIVPMGDNNDMPGEVMRLLDKFYAGEGIMGKGNTIITQQGTYSVINPEMLPFVRSYFHNLNDWLLQR